jgi:hypothetical protein
MAGSGAGYIFDIAKRRVGTELDLWWNGHGKGGEAKV